MKNKNFILYAITFLLVGTTIYSCKKDLVKEEINESIKAEQQQLKVWYEKNADKSESNLFSSMKPEWKDSFMSEHGDLQVFEITLKNPEKVLQVKESVDQTNIKSYADKNNIRLIIFKNKKNDIITTAGYMSILSNKNTIDPSAIHYKEFQKLDGNVLYYHLNGDFNNGWQYTDGRIVGRIFKGTEEGYLATKQMQAMRSQNKGKLMSFNGEGGGCSTEPVYEWRTACVGVEGHMRCDLVRGGIKYLSKCADFDEGGGGGDGGGYDGGDGGGGSGPGPAPAAPPVKVEVDPKARPCLGQIKSALEALGLKTNTSDKSGLIAGILNKLNLSTGPNFNAIITEGVTEGSLAATTLTTNMNTWGPQSLVAQIKFNSENLNKMTNLKVAATMMHEYVHAYFDWNAYLIRNGMAGSDSGFQEKYTLLFDKTGKPMPDDVGGSTQHRQMAELFVTEISSMLKTYAEAQGIPMPADKEYFNKMGWGGLLGTPAGKFAPVGTEYTLGAEQGATGTTITQKTDCQ